MRGTLSLAPKVANGRHNEMMRILVPFGLAIALVASQPSTDPLAGRWRSREVSPSGVSAVFEFSGGQLDSYAAVIVEEQFRLAGTDTIFLQHKSGREEKLELEWDNQDHARIDDEAAGKSIELVRVGKSAGSKNPLSGEWKTTREWKGQAYPALAVFLAGGRVIWVTRVHAEHGRYSVQNQNIRLEIPNRPPVEGRFALTGESLTLPNPRGGQSSFERF